LKAISVLGIKPLFDHHSTTGSKGLLFLMFLIMKFMFMMLRVTKLQIIKIKIIVTVKMRKMLFFGESRSPARRTDRAREGVTQHLMNFERDGCSTASGSVLLQI